MRKTMFIAGVLAILCTWQQSSVQAQVSQVRMTDRFGVGFIVGDPTGVAMSYRLSQWNAISGAIGRMPGDRFRVHADYVWLTRPFDERNFGIHYGLGGFAGTTRRADDDDGGFGIRGVAGFNYFVPSTPIDLFIEVGPTLSLTPSTGTGLDAGFGIRVYP